jgi:hypothetical protein
MVRIIGLGVVHLISLVLRGVEVSCHMSSLGLSGLNGILQEASSVSAIDDDLEAEAVSNSPESWEALTTTIDAPVVSGSVLTNIVDQVSQVVCDNTAKNITGAKFPVLYFLFSAHYQLTII